MSNLTNAIVMYVRCDASEYKKEIKECKKGTEDWQNAVNKKKTAEQFLAIATAVTVVVKVMKDLYKALSACVDSANTFNKSFTKLQGVIRNSGFSASAKDMDDYATALSQASQYTRSEINDVQTLYIATNQLTEDGVKRATLATLDLATAMGKDLTTASRSLMKALEEPQTAMEGLRRSGIVFTEAEVEAIKNLEKYGRIAEAQEKILAKVESKYQGISKAISDTPTGTLDKIKNTWENIKTNLGNAILDSISPALNALLDTLTKLKKWSDGVVSANANEWAKNVGMAENGETPNLGAHSEGKLDNERVSLLSFAKRMGSDYVKTRIAELKAMEDITKEGQDQLRGWESILDEVVQYEASVKSIKAGMEDITGESEKIPTLYEEWKKLWDENEQSIKDIEKEIEEIENDPNLSASPLMQAYLGNLQKKYEKLIKTRDELSGKQEEALKEDKIILTMEETRLQKIAEIEAQIAEAEKFREQAMASGDSSAILYYDKKIADLNKSLNEYQPTEITEHIISMEEERLERIASINKDIEEANKWLAIAIQTQNTSMLLYYQQMIEDLQSQLDKLQPTEKPVEPKEVDDPYKDSISHAQKLEMQYNSLLDKAESLREEMGAVSSDSITYDLLKTELQGVEDRIDSMTGKVDSQADAVNHLQFAWESIGLTWEDLAKTGVQSMYSSLEQLGEALGSEGASFKDFAKIGIEAIASLIDALGQQALIKTGENIAKFFETKDPTYLSASAKYGSVAGLSAMASGVVRGGLARFEHGGIVGGSGITGDKHLIRANAGELILSRIQQERLAHALGGGNSNVISVNFNGQTFGDQDTIATYVYDGIERAKRKGLI